MINKRKNKKVTVLSARQPLGTTQFKKSKRKNQGRGKYYQDHRCLKISCPDKNFVFRLFRKKKIINCRNDNRA